MLFGFETLPLLSEFLLNVAQGFFIILIVLPDIENMHFGQKHNQNLFISFSAGSAEDVSIKYPAYNAKRCHRLNKRP